MGCFWQRKVSVSDGIHSSYAEVFSWIGPVRAARRVYVGRTPVVQRSVCSQARETDGSAGMGTPEKAHLQS